MILGTNLGSKTKFHQEQRQITWLMQSFKFPRRVYCWRTMQNQPQRQWTDKLLPPRVTASSSGDPWGAVGGHCVKVLISALHWQGAGAITAVSGSVLYTERWKESGRKLEGFLSDCTTSARHLLCRHSHAELSVWKPGSTASYSPRNLTFHLVLPDSDNALHLNVVLWHRYLMKSNNWIYAVIYSDSH